MGRPLGKKGTRLMANMNVADSWKDESTLVEYLAKQLILGRLAIVLGAGISQFYGLPKWAELIENICRDLGEPPMPSGGDPLLKAGTLKAKYFNGNEQGFSEAVKKALYKNIRPDFQSIRKNDLLSAIGALSMSSSRGNASTIITFNYDDLLELFLEYHGYDTASIDDAKHWAPRHDISIYHPHGLLPLTPGRPVTSTAIVLATSDYLSILGSSSQNLWKPLLQTIFRTHTFLHIGLSGTDLHLQSLVHDLKDTHVITKDRVRYHGIRFVESGKINEDLLIQYDQWGVFTQVVEDFDIQLPRFLFSICQSARVQRSKMDQLGV